MCVSSACQSAYECFHKKKKRRTNLVSAKKRERKSTETEMLNRTEKIEKMIYKIMIYISQQSNKTQTLRQTPISEKRTFYMTWWIMQVRQCRPNQNGVKKNKPNEQIIDMYLKTLQPIERQSCSSLHASCPCRHRLTRWHFLTQPTGTSGYQTKTTLRTLDFFNTTKRVQFKYTYI